MFKNFKVFYKFYTNNRISMRRAIALYSFLIRLYHYEDDILDKTEASLKQTHGKSLEDLHRMYYNFFEDGFCQEKDEKKKTKARNATINCHVFSHLLESRRRSGPLQETSTEDFESLYAVLGRCYVAGTRNTPKQCFENHYIKQK